MAGAGGADKNMLWPKLLLICGVMSANDDPRCLFPDPWISLMAELEGPAKIGSG